MSVLAALLPTLAAIAILAALTVGILWGSRTPSYLSPALAILRGAAQLAVISLVLGGVISNPLWVGAALLVMFSVAAVTATRRLTWSWRRFGLVAGTMAAGILVTVAVVFGTGAIEFSPRYALAVGGIVIGNSMTIATLAGRRFFEAVVEQWDQVEGWLALGATPRQATLVQARQAVHSALIPSTDQTKTTGLVTLPGAFVGAIFGGASPFEAGRFQVVVLASIMAAGSITAVALIRSLGNVKVRPDPL
ncbi:ABC transporter permease [Pseudarthrobacter niigatensis]|uniref:ABC transport system permease protein n=1 Tax=Pseudarthrobacter niigatensis TaxID=369935 RepID=A0AAJ1STC7_9MICC|nr:ABC transporter permease [Pseudarthrobacter niigatensis]MDQ0146049.1 putative ABC transport system permease protein [Pseudarthrobacter niigatensis]MDQ0266223.1 putative ABC transport system permease protein [Pseudarthrobacter niigatensis]